MPMATTRFPLTPREHFPNDPPKQQARTCMECRLKAYNIGSLARKAAKRYFPFEEGTCRI